MKPVVMMIEGRVAQNSIYLLQLSGMLTLLIFRVACGPVNLPGSTLSTMYTNALSIKYKFYLIDAFLNVLTQKFVFHKQSNVQMIKMQ